MAIQFPCAACGKTLSVPDAAAGKKAKCPACGAISTAPVAVASSPSPAVVAGSGGQTTPGGQPNSGLQPAAGVPLPPPTRVLKPGDPKGLGGLLQELTPSDLQTKAERLALEAKEDPLAPYLKNWREYRDRPPVGPRPIPIWIISACIALFGLLQLYRTGQRVYLLYMEKGWDPFTTLNQTSVGLAIVGAIILAILLTAIGLLSQSQEGWWFAQIMINCWVVGWVVKIYKATRAAPPMEMLTEGLMILSILACIATMVYLNYKPVRENYRVQYRVWVGPLVAIPLGIALDVAFRYGIPELFKYLEIDLPRRF